MCVCYPFSLIVQGSEGGTGAAPPEFSNSIGTPLVEGLVLVDDLLRGAGLRENVKIICSGKVRSAVCVRACVRGSARVWLAGVGDRPCGR